MLLGENAYHIQMYEYLTKGNRPQALKTHLKCNVILEEKYGISPLSETKRSLQKIE